jgi:hypothetical protein
VIPSASASAARSAASLPLSAEPQVRARSHSRGPHRVLDPRDGNPLAGADQRLPGMLAGIRQVHRVDPVGDLPAQPRYCRWTPPVAVPYAETAVMPHPAWWSRRRSAHGQHTCRQQHPPVTTRTSPAAQVSRVPRAARPTNYPGRQTAASDFVVLTNHMIARRPREQPAAASSDQGSPRSRSEWLLSY